MSLLALLRKMELVLDLELEHVVEEAQQSGEAILTILVRNRLVDDDQVARLLSLQQNLNRVDLDKRKIDADAVRLLSGQLAARLRAIPVSVHHTPSDGDLLYVAMSDPSDPRRTSEVERATGMRVQPLVANESALQRALLRHYSADERSPGAAYQGDPSRALALDDDLGPSQSSPTLPDARRPDLSVPSIPLVMGELVGGAGSSEETLQLDRDELLPHYQAGPGPQHPPQQAGADSGPSLPGASGIHSLGGPTVPMSAEAGPTEALASSLPDQGPPGADEWLTANTGEVLAVYQQKAEDSPQGETTDDDLAWLEQRRLGGLAPPSPTESGKTRVDLVGPTMLVCPDIGLRQFIKVRLETVASQIRDHSSLASAMTEDVPVQNVVLIEPDQDPELLATLKALRAKERPPRVYVVSDNKAFEVLGGIDVRVSSPDDDEQMVASVLRALTAGRRKGPPVPRR